MQRDWRQGTGKRADERLSRVEQKAGGFGQEGVPGDGEDAGVAGRTVRDARGDDTAEAGDVVVVHGQLCGGAGGVPVPGATDEGLGGVPAPQLLPPAGGQDLHCDDPHLLEAVCAAAAADQPAHRCGEDGGGHHPGELPHEGLARDGVP